MSAPPCPTIRVFVSSPGDVRAERGAVLRAIALLNQRYRDQVSLEGLFWEDQFFPSITDFQSWINQQIPPWSCQLVICILWSRIGSPLSDTWPARSDGTRYESGTVAEFEMSRDHALTDGNPDLYMFLKQAPLAGADTAEVLARAAEAKRVVEQFVLRWFHQSDPVEAPGAGPLHPFTAGFNPFASTEEFEAEIAGFLEWWLRQKGYIDQPLSWDVHSQGLPYVGLTPFDAAHASVFFGRDAERRRARRLLTEADAAGFPYLVLSGGSGAGKSSLARAGLVADLCIDTPQEVWTSVILLADADPLPALVRALLDSALGPFLTSAHFGTPERLVTALAAADVAATILTGVLDDLAHARAGERGWSATPLARLLLIIDQAEALADASPATQRGVTTLIATLAATRRIWVVTTIRSDRQSALLALAPPPPIAQLLTGLFREDLAPGAELKLTPPDEAAIREIIEAPARAAGLSFEEGESGHTLADELRQAMSGQPDALPLMQKLLQRMFASSREARWSDYERLGSLSGAIADAADAAIAPLTDAARSELSPLLLVLTADIEADGSAVSRPAERAAFETSPSRTALVSALLEARLLAVDGKGRMRVAHEAVLRTWPRARESLAGAASFIRLRERLRGPWQEWQGGGSLLPPGPLLSEAALSLALLRTEADTAPLADLVQASLDADRRARRRRTAIWSSVTLALALFAGGSIFFAITANRSKQAATASAAQSERNLAAALDVVNKLIFSLAGDLRDRGEVSLPAVSAILGTSDRALDELEKAAPDDDRVTWLRNKSLMEMSATLLARGEVADAHDMAVRAVASAEALLARDPDDVTAKEDLAISHTRVGDTLMALGDIAGALTQYRTGLTMLEPLASQDEGNIALWRELSVSRGKMGDVFAAQGDGADALVEYRANLELLERLKSKQEYYRDSLLDLAVTHSQIGKVLLARGDRAGALREYLAGLETSGPLTIAGFETPQSQAVLISAHEDVGDVLIAQGDVAGALREYRAALAIAEQWESRDAGNPAWQRTLKVLSEKVESASKASGKPNPSKK